MRPVREDHQLQSLLRPRGRRNGALQGLPALASRLSPDWALTNPAVPFYLVAQTNACRKGTANCQEAEMTDTQKLDYYRQAIYRIAVALGLPEADVGTYTIGAVIAAVRYLKKEMETSAQRECHLEDLLQVSDETLANTQALLHEAQQEILAYQEGLKYPPPEDLR